MKNCFLFLLLVISTTVAFGQDLKNDLSKAVANMMPINRESKYSISIEYFDRDNLLKPVDSLLIHYSFYNKCMKIQVNDLETVQNENYFVTVSTEDKIMIVGKATANPSQLYDYTKLDSLFFLINFKAILLKNINSTYVYRVKTPENSIDSLDLAIDVKNDEIKEIVLYFSKDYRATEDNLPAPIVKITYLNFVLANPTKNTINNFSTDKYFSYKNNIAVPVNLYDDYEIIDNMKFEAGNSQK